MSVQTVVLDMGLDEDHLEKLYEDYGDQPLNVVVVNSMDPHLEDYQESRNHRGNEFAELWTNPQGGQPQNRTKLRWWQSLHGNFMYWWKGGLMLGPKLPAPVFRCLIHLAIFIVSFYIFELGQLWAFYSTFSIVGFGILAISCILMVYNGYLVSTTEPGIIERPDGETRRDNMLNYNLERTPGVEFIKRVLVNGEMINCKFCKICCNYLPPKAEHCEMSGCCIQRFNHYSTFFGTSIGFGNFGYYMKFLFFANVVIHIMEVGLFHVLYSNIVEHGWVYALKFSPTVYIYALGVIISPYAVLSIPKEFVQQLFCFLSDKLKLETDEKQTTADDKTSIYAKFKKLMGNLSAMLFKLPPKSPNGYKPDSKTPNPETPAKGVVPGCPQNCVVPEHRAFLRCYSHVHNTGYGNCILPGTGEIGYFQYFLDSRRDSQ